ncbi:Uncharacterized protein TCAP_00285 [Tolypocladium capitatum]|uniref:Carbohydrate-binding module family 19 domain-containing protein n=1 Tax=Tolypocladium capitatum TaxID=45235 RepID=A0A2K3QQL5_9HYPO|nr:Uncharacterized protein TCAP_00285 [Tolypocladium capitatum]
MHLPSSLTHILPGTRPFVNMRCRLRLSAALYLLLTAQPGQAGPLNWAGRIVPRGDPISGASNYPTTAPLAVPSSNGGSNGAMYSTPRPEFRTLSGSSIVIPSSLLSVTKYATEPSSAAASTSIPLVVVPIDGKSSTPTETSTTPASSLASNTHGVTSQGTYSTTVLLSAYISTAPTTTPVTPGSSAPGASSGYADPSSPASSGSSTGVASYPGSQSTSAGTGTATANPSGLTSLPSATGTAPAASRYGPSSITSTLGGTQSTTKHGISESTNTATALPSSSIQTSLPGLSSEPTYANASVPFGSGSSLRSGTLLPSASTAITLPASSNAGTGQPTGVPSSTLTMGTPATSVDDSSAVSPTGIPTVILPSRSSQKPGLTTPTTTTTVPPSGPSSSTSSASTPLPLPPSLSFPSAIPGSTTQSQRPTDTITIRPTGNPNTAVPTENPTYPTATSSVFADIYADNLSRAKNLNNLFATLTPQSACSGSQVACINGQIARCQGGAFQLEACPSDQKCLAFPMTNSPGASVGCRDPNEAQRVLGEGARSGSSSSSASASAVPPTSTPARPVVTMTTVVTVVDSTSTSAAGPPSYTPEPPQAPSPSSSSAQPTVATPSPSPSTPPTTAPASDPPRQTASERGRSTIIESIKQPSATQSSSSPVAQETSSINYASPPAPNPTSLVLWPLDGPPTPTKASSPPAVASDKAAGSGGSGGDNPKSGGSGSINKAGGVPRTTEAVNGTPTVSVYFTVTVTEKQRETQTVTLIVPAN